MITCVAASQLERQWIGVDIDAHYVELAEKRVAEEGRPEQDPSLCSG